MAVYFNGNRSLQQGDRHYQPLLALVSENDSFYARERAGVEANSLAYGKGRMGNGVESRPQDGQERRHFAFVDRLRRFAETHYVHYTWNGENRQAVRRVKTAKNVPGKQRQTAAM